MLNMTFHCLHCILNVKPKALTKSFLELYPAAGALYPDEGAPYPEEGAP